VLGIVGHTSTTDSADIQIADGYTLATIYGTADESEAADSVLAFGNPIIIGDSTISDSSDSQSSFGNAILSGTADSIDQTDNQNLIGNVGIPGYSNTTDSSDNQYAYAVYWGSVKQ
jgi:hypothetical protein